MKERSVGILAAVVCVPLFCVASSFEFMGPYLVTLVIYQIVRACGGQGWTTQKDQDWRFFSFLVLTGFHVVAIFFVPVALLIDVMLLFGWIPFLRRTLPHVTFDIGSVALGIGTLMGFLVGVHWLGASLVNRPEADGQPSRVWKLRWTGAIAATVALLFVSGLAAYGLLRSGISVWELRR